ncbi:MAG: hypothetical protein FWD55_09220 [Propionibacteriaceae bacterium]|nr:hypothetical protein [Propionibacteriaceae bacterium]
MHASDPRAAASSASSSDRQCHSRIVCPGTVKGDGMGAASLIGEDTDEGIHEIIPLIHR